MKLLREISKIRSGAYTHISIYGLLRTSCLVTLRGTVIKKLNPVSMFIADTGRSNRDDIYLYARIWAIARKRLSIQTTRGYTYEHYPYEPGRQCVYRLITGHRVSQICI